MKRFWKALNENIKIKGKEILIPGKGGKNFIERKSCPKRLLQIFALINTSNGLEYKTFNKKNPAKLIENINKSIFYTIYFYTN